MPARWRFPVSVVSVPATQARQRHEFVDELVRGDLVRGVVSPHANRADPSATQLDQREARL